MHRRNRDDYPTGPSRVPEGRNWHIAWTAQPVTPRMPPDARRWRWNRTECSSKCAEVAATRPPECPRRLDRGKLRPGGLVSWPPLLARRRPSAYLRLLSAGGGNRGSGNRSLFGIFAAIGAAQLAVQQGAAQWRAPTLHEQHRRRDRVVSGVWGDHACRVPSSDDLGSRAVARGGARRTSAPREYGSIRASNQRINERPNRCGLSGNIPAGITEGCGSRPCISVAYRCGKMGRRTRSRGTHGRRRQATTRRLVRPPRVLPPPPGDRRQNMVHRRSRPACRSSRVDNRDASTASRRGGPYRKSSCHPVIQLARDRRRQLQDQRAQHPRRSTRGEPRARHEQDRLRRSRRDQLRIQPGPAGDHPGSAPHRASWELEPDRTVWWREVIERGTWKVFPGYVDPERRRAWRGSTSATSR